MDILFETSGKLIVTEWKFYRIQYLDIRIPGNTSPDSDTKAATLRNYRVDQVLQLKFGVWDKFHGGMVKGQPMKEGQQLKHYIKSQEVVGIVDEKKLKLQVYLIIIVGSRHILIWEMDDRIIAQ